MSRLGENRTPSGDARRALAASAATVADFLDGIAHAERLLVEERPGAGGALPAPVVIDDAALARLRSGSRRMYFELSPPISKTVRTSG